jgi:anionic cell wall polymer biosynthesis LytR-Cps2A-Psr (LCP) family protein
MSGPGRRRRADGPNETPQPEPDTLAGQPGGGRRGRRGTDPAANPTAQPQPQPQQQPSGQWFRDEARSAQQFTPRPTTSQPMPPSPASPPSPPSPGGWPPAAGQQFAPPRQPTYGTRPPTVQPSAFDTGTQPAPPPDPAGWPPQQYSQPRPEPGAGYQLDAYQGPSTASPQQPSVQQPSTQQPSTQQPSTQRQFSAPTVPPQGPAPTRGGQVQLTDDDFADLGLDDDDEPGAQPASATTGMATSTATDDRQPDYGSTDFAFVDEPDTDNGDVLDWKVFADSRADLRDERVRRFRFRLVAAGSALLLVVAGVLTYLFAFDGSGGGPRQTTMLVQVDDDNGQAVGNLLLVVGPTNSVNHGVLMTIPADLAVSAPGGSQPFGGNARLQVPPADQSVLASLLGIRVDGTWSITQLTLGLFIDDLGGVVVNADTTVPSVKKGGKPLVRPGNATLDGGEAIAYAFYRAPGEPESAQLNRLAQVFTAMLSKLPTADDAMNLLLGHLGTVSDPSFPNTKLAAALVEASAQAQANQLTQASLPVTSDGSGTIDVAAAGPLVKNLLGGVLQSQPPSSGTRVLVENGTGNAQLTQQLLGLAQIKLVNAGDSFVAGGNATGPPQSTSSVEVGSAGGQNTANQVAETLNLPLTAVHVVSGLPSLADVVVVLGNDWATRNAPTASAPAGGSTPPSPGTATTGSSATPGG